MAAYLNLYNRETKRYEPFPCIVGAPGVSPTVEVTDITGGHRVTIIDADGSETFDVPDGTAETFDVTITDTDVADSENAEFIYDLFPTFTEDVVEVSIEYGQLYAALQAGRPVRIRVTEEFTANVGYKIFPVELVMGYAITEVGLVVVTRDIAWVFVNGPDHSEETSPYADTL